MKVRQLVSAACMMLASLLLVGQTLQNLGLSTSDAKEAKQVRKKRQGRVQGGQAQAEPLPAAK
jgi:hypothetical protein